MPVFATTTAAPVIQAKTPLTILSDKVIDNLGGLAVTTRDAHLQPLKQFGISSPAPTSVKANLKAAWSDSVPTPDQLKVWSFPVPVGAVLTHETITDSVAYRAYPLSDVTPVSISAQVQTQYKQISRGTGKDKVTVMAAFFDAALRENAQYSSGTNSQAALQKSIAIVSASEGRTVSQSQLQKEVNEATVKDVEAAGNEQAIRKLRQRIGKIYLGDLQPKSAELRFVVHDVVSSLPDGTPQLSRHRFQVASDLRRMFCVNGMGTNEVSSAYSALADAARLNANATAGHIVQLSSPGIDGWGVDRWLVTSYEQVQVPDRDVIAVRVRLVELFSILSAPVEPPGSKLNMPVTDSSAPAIDLPVRPNYVTQNLGAIG